jgi:hypothetical protein
MYQCGASLHFAALRENLEMVWSLLGDLNADVENKEVINTAIFLRSWKATFYIIRCLVHEVGVYIKRSAT